MNLIRKTNPRTHLFWIVLTSFLAMAIYLFHSQSKTGLGFPLDDAWIHQTYARNLAHTGEWSFIPGQQSGGSTSPLWSILISIGYIFSNRAIFWTYFLGWTALTLTGIFGEKIFRNINPDIPLRFPAMGLFLVLEWHLVWASVSGMETLFLACSILLLFWLVIKEQKNWWAAGFVAGVSVWIRPDAITLLGPALFVSYLTIPSWKEKINACLQILVSFLICFIPYLVFNQQIAGSIWPNTFYAKQAEYQELTRTSIFLRTFRMLTLPMIGAGILLLPGTLYFGYVSWRRKNWAGIGMLVWWVGYTLLYVLRLPVVYQHGRYLMPGMPVFYLCGLAGSFLYIYSHQKESHFNFILQTSWSAGIVITLGLFFIMGSRTYANDVGIIETEMVQTAQWVAENIPQGSMIAAHDIGALGYWGNHPIVDLAGLISPDVIPFLRDEDALAVYLSQKNVKYLVTFPGWYPSLIKNGKVIYTSEGRYSPEQGGENMTVYELFHSAIPISQK